MKIFVQCICRIAWFANLGFGSIWSAHVLFFVDVVRYRLIPPGRPWTGRTYVSTHTSTRMYKISVHIYQTSSSRDSSPKNHAAALFLSCRGIKFIMPRHYFYHAAALFLSCRGMIFIMPAKFFYLKRYERGHDPWQHMRVESHAVSWVVICRYAPLSPLPAPSPSTMPTTIESNISPPQWHRLLQLMHTATLATVCCLSFLLWKESVDSIEGRGHCHRPRARWQHSKLIKNISISYVLN